VESSCTDNETQIIQRQARFTLNDCDCARAGGCYRLPVTTLLIATRNARKTDEIRAILGGGFQFLTLNDFPDAPKVVEDAGTFAGNAAKKAVELAKWISSQHRTSNIERPTPNFVLADDSGLEVDALNGAPGVHSARFAALDRSADSLSANSPDVDNNAKLLRLLKDVPPEKRTARFRCVIALVQVQSPKSKVQSPQLFDGACEGRIGFEPHGHNGFGYDPLFVPDGFKQTFAELGDAVKNKLSHRARALEKLKEFLEGSASSLP
jgi:XTP/dITP diphosphohydrolase